eukprot:sb/3466727/
MKVIISLLLVSLASSEMFNIGADISMLLDYEYSDNEDDACFSGVAKQLKFDGENWALLNWTGSDGDNTDGHGDNSLVTSCRGNFDVFQVAMESDVAYMSGQEIRAWNTFMQLLHQSIEITCSLSVRPLSQIEPLCSGTSACLTDECQCGDGKPVFYCPGKLGGCIPFSQVCDGVANCEGGTDECMCSGAVTVHCLPDKSYTACIPEKKVCALAPTLSILSCDNTSHCNDPTEGDSAARVLQNTLNKHYTDILEGDFAGGVKKTCIEIVGPYMNVTTNSTTSTWLFDLCGSLGVTEKFILLLEFHCINTGHTLEAIHGFQQDLRWCV